MLVSQILKTKQLHDVVTAPPTMTISEAARILSENRIGTVVVSRDSETADGILSERDIVRELGARGAGCLTQTVESLMTSKLITCSVNDKADEVLQKMTEGRFRHMPILKVALVPPVSVDHIAQATAASALGLVDAGAYDGSDEINAVAKKMGHF